MTLKLNNIDIWYIKFNNKKILSLSYLITILSKKELYKANSFIKVKDKKNYIITHAYLRIVLSKYNPNIAPEEWEFSINEYGKPFLSKKYNIKLYFNLSHTDTTVAFIFNRMYSCGIDIEENTKIIINNDMANLVLSEGEKILYNNSKMQKDFFYKLWVLKEAYVKNIGIGFQKSFKTIDFSHIKKIASKENIIFTNKNYQFGFFKMSQNICLAYCLKCDREIKIINFYTLKDV